jgi:hypothetical protein
MFTAEERDRVRERLLELAEADPGVAAAAITGSDAAHEGDKWSDIDLAFAIDDDVPEALERWTGLRSETLGVLHHCAASRVRPPRPDLAHRPWRGGRAGAGCAARRDDLIGLAWHHLLHARACVERGKPWQAEYWISALRDHVLDARLPAPGPHHLVCKGRRPATAGTHRSAQADARLFARRDGATPRPRRRRRRLLG